MGHFFGQVSLIEEFESALNFVASGSVIGAKFFKLVMEFKSALNFVASGSAFWAKVSSIEKKVLTIL